MSRPAGAGLAPVARSDLGRLPGARERRRQVQDGRRSRSPSTLIPGEIFKGEVEAFDARLNQDARTLMVRARVPNPERKLLPGMFANVAVLAGEPKDFVTVPRTALTYRLYGDSVWVVKEGAAEPAATPPPTVERAGASAVAADATPTGAVPAEPKLTAERRFVRVGPSAGRPGRHPRRRQGGRGGGDQRPAQIAARRRHQGRQFRRAEAAGGAAEAVSPCTSPISSSSGRCLPPWSAC